MVDIRPEVSIYQVFRHINYKKWNAIAEFVDNSVQSFLSGREQHAPEHKLVVAIDVLKSPDGEFSLRVTDNSFGIDPRDFQRAFRPGNPPANRNGLSEFGVGMKFAACFFARKWVVTTRPHGSETSYVFHFDTEQIEPLESCPSQHPTGTSILMKGLYEPLHPATVGKIKRHLSGIYRCFLKNGDISILFNGDKLEYSEPSVLKAKPHWEDARGEDVEWTRTISFEVSGGKRVSGFVALRSSMSADQAGLALFRRGRAILGSDDDNYRPKEIFGSIGSFEYKRVFGELHLEGFEVSHTKDAIQWGDAEDAVIHGIKQQLSTEPSLLRQAREYRVGVRRDQDSIRHLKEVSQQSLQRIESIVKDAGTDIGRAFRAAVDSASTVGIQDTEGTPSTSDGSNDEIANASSSIGLNLNPFVFDTEERQWQIYITFTDTRENPLFKITQYQDEERSGRLVSSFEIVINRAHSFIDKYSTYDIESSDSLIVFLIALSISEIMVRSDGHPFAGALRRCVNELVTLI